MSIERSLHFGVFLSAVILSGAISPEGRSAERHYEDYPEWQLLPKGVDLEDDAEIAALQRLEDEGDAVREFLLAVVRDCDALLPASTALGILKGGPGDKKELAAELRRIFAARFPGDGRDEEWFLIDLGRALVDLGTEEDMEALLPMLSHPRWEVRINGARFLGIRGGERALEALQAAHLRDEWKTDQKEIEDAVFSIERRLSGVE